MPTTGKTTKKTVAVKKASTVKAVPVKKAQKVVPAKKGPAKKASPSKGTVSKKAVSVTKSPPKTTQAKGSTLESAAQRAVTAKKVAVEKARALSAAKNAKEREAKAKAAAKERATLDRTRAAAALKAKKERDAKAKAAAKEKETQRKAREKAAAEAKKQREIDAKRKAIEGEKLRKLREIERRNQEELKRQERRDADERKRREALERKMHSRPYAQDSIFLDELRQLMLESREATFEQIAISEREADEMLVDRERLEYDDEDGSSVASDIKRDELKDFLISRRDKIAELEVALVRITDGSYGRCDECYEPITKARLVAQVPVFTCVSCRASV